RSAAARAARAHRVERGRHGGSTRTGPAFHRAEGLGAGLRATARDRAARSELRRRHRSQDDDRSLRQGVGTASARVGMAPQAEFRTVLKETRMQRRDFLIGAGALAAAGSMPAFGQNFPSRPITLY